MPGTHRTPPDADGDLVLQGGQVSRAALSAYMLDLAAHLSPDARRALTRDLAAKDGDVVVAANDAETGAVWIEIGACLDDTLAAASRLLSAVDAS